METMSEQRAAEQPVSNAADCSPATAVRERPILFSDPMVRAILDGRKTQTRRIVKAKGIWSVVDREDGTKWPGGEDQCGDWQDFPCPFGSAGDRLWVRETWSPMPNCRPIPNPEKYDNKPAWYKADNDRPMWAGDKWTPSIFMSRVASRITLEITSIRAERLHGISEEDAIAEGTQCAGVPASLTNRGAFAQLWSTIHAADGPNGWAANPWVWVIGFKRI